MSSEGTRWCRSLSAPHEANQTQWPVFRVHCPWEVWTCRLWRGRIPTQAKPRSCWWYLKLYELEVAHIYELAWLHIFASFAASYSRSPPCGNFKSFKVRDGIYFFYLQYLFCLLQSSIFWSSQSFHFTSCWTFKGWVHYEWACNILVVILPSSCL